MTFLYVVPGESNNSVDIKKVGLEYAFEGPPIKRLLYDAFDCKESALLADKTVKAERTSYDPEQQTWRKVGSIHVGYWNDSFPTEESLRRKVQLEGDSILLREEQWTIPKAVSFEDTPDGTRFDYPLSRYIDVTEDGEITLGAIEEQFDDLVDVALKWYGFDDHKFTDDAEYFTCAATVMSYNYRVGLPELAILKVLTVDTATTIIKSCADYDSYSLLTNEDAKKKASDDLTMSDGETDTHEAISPLLQTS